MDGDLYTDFSDLGPAAMDAFEREARRGFEQEKFEYRRRQLAIRREQEELSKHRRVIDGLGPPVACIDARTYIRWAQEDPHFWDDAGNRKRFYRDNPEVLVPKAENTPTTIVVP